MPFSKLWDNIYIHHLWETFLFRRLYEPGELKYQGAEEEGYKWAQVDTDGGGVQLHLCTLI